MSKGKDNTDLALSWASSPARRRIMVANRSRDTRPELALRRALRSMGFGFRVATRPDRLVRRTADLVFVKARVAVFVDGCFWHACPEHGPRPKVNADYWEPKLQATTRRDADTDVRLRALGWAVVRVWEHEDVTTAAVRIATMVRERRGSRWSRQAESSEDR